MQEDRRSPSRVRCEAIEEAKRFSEWRAHQCQAFPSEIRNGDEHLDHIGRSPSTVDSSSLQQTMASILHMSIFNAAWIALGKHLRMFEEAPQTQVLQANVVLEEADRMKLLEAVLSRRLEPMKQEE